MSNRSISLTDSLYEYLLAVSLREPDLLRQLRQETAADPWPHADLSRAGAVHGAAGAAHRCATLPGDRRLHRLFVAGAGTGAAGRRAHRRLRRERRVDLGGASLLAAAGVAHKIDLRLAPALETMAGLLAAGEAGRFDFAFLDADKENYLRYYELALELLRPGGLLVADNTLWSGRVADPANTEATTEALRRFNEQLHRDERVT